MLTPSQVDAVVEEHLRYAAARKSETNICRTDEPDLRKEWLKRRFGSFDYHEKLLEIHAAWLALIYAGLARPEVQRDYPEEYAFLNGPARKNFDKAPKPGQLDPSLWRPGRQTGWARSILDYGRDSGLDVSSVWDWMKPDEQAKMFPLWGAMTSMAQNIQYTVDGNWDAHPDQPFWILDEYFTGPVDWPSNWREEVLHSQATASNSPQVKSGQPAPPSGTWESIDPSRRRVQLNAGELLPPSNSAYGITVWQRVGD